MKRTYIAAAALLLGTSVIAWAQSEPVPVGKDPLVATTEIVKPTVKEVLTAKEARPMDQAEALAADPEKVDTDLTDSSEAGVGGPLEPADVAATTAASELTPRRATHNYPPCDPGPGDDNCIQLYEPGVRVALASWNQPTGGLADHAATTAMGGPYEPVDSSADVAWDGDGVIDSAAGETALPEGAQTAEYTGVGGPVAETGYPPCSPGPGDDRCIQLYERGVTGAGN